MPTLQKWQESTGHYNWQTRRKRLLIKESIRRLKNPDGVGQFFCRDKRLCSLDYYKRNSFIEWRGKTCDLKLKKNNWTVWIVFPKHVGEDPVLKYNQTQIFRPCLQKNDLWKHLCFSMFIVVDKHKKLMEYCIFTKAIICSEWEEIIRCALWLVNVHRKEGGEKKKKTVIMCLSGNPDAELSVSCMLHNYTQTHEYVNVPLDQGWPRH